MVLQSLPATQQATRVDPRSIEVLRINHTPAKNYTSRATSGDVILALQNLDIALSIKADQLIGTETGEASRDNVIKRLTEALVAAEAAHDTYSGICADALRLAIVTYQATRQAEQPSNRGRNARSLQKWRLKRVLEFIDHNLAKKIGLEDLAAVAGLSRMHFAAQFRVATGQRPHELLLRRRIERAEDLLRQGDMPLAEIALEVGFQTQAHFTTTFKRFTGDTPHQWRCAHLAMCGPLPAKRAGLS